MRVRRTQQDWRALYLEFLDSPDWAVKRIQILRRANYRCECCLSPPATEIHHTVYPQVRSGALTLQHFVDQPNWQLRAICRACHQRETAARR